MLVLSVHTSFAQQAPETNVSLRGAFGALPKDSDGTKLHPITRDTTLRSGDQFKMMVQLQTPCYVYVIHHSSQGEIGLLFPDGVHRFDVNPEVGKRYYIPKEDDWFEFDEQTGRETFYLLAADERLGGLEDLLIRYGNADVQAKPGIAGEIISEIRNIRKKHRELAAPAERPVTIGGAIRGFDIARESKRPDVASIAEEIVSTSLIARTFTIEHQ
jgi:hypothetical protein